MGASPASTLPIFIPEWSIWDRVITHHYEDASKPAKDFMYELVELNARRSDKLSTIPNELKSVLDGAFGGRTAFDFLIEHGACVESIPPILTQSFTKSLHHSHAVLLLGLWKSLNFPEVYIVTEDENFITGLDEIKKIGLDFSHLHVVNPEKALGILQKCKE